MAYIIKLKTVIDYRGSLTVGESLKDIPFEIKRFYYIYKVNPDISRGGHRHFKTRQALICINGRCTISNNDGKSRNDFILDAPDKCLVLDPEDFHNMHSFSKDAVLLVLASEYFDPEDYIDEDYEND